mgnify:CR=1 FL=1
MSVSIWVVDDDRSIRWVLEKALGQEGYAVTCFEDADEALNTLEQGGQEPEVLISDVRMPGTDGLRMLKILQRKNPNLPVIIMTAHSDLDSAVASYQGGAFEYLPKPFDVDEAVALVKRAIKHRKENDEEFVAPAPETPNENIGEAPAMQGGGRANGRRPAEEPVPYTPPTLPAGRQGATPVGPRTTRKTRETKRPERQGSRR